ncbi:MAG: CDP-glycerol glycerophosphotransferase family protein [Methanolobus sp.]
MDSIEKNALDWMKKWADNTVDVSGKGDNIKRILEYKGITLWWFIETAVFESYRGLNYPISMRKLIENIERIEAIIKAEKPDQIYFLNTSVPHNFYLGKICLALGLDTVHVKSPKVKILRVFWIKIFPFLLSCYFRFRIFCRKLISGLLNLLFKKEKAGLDAKKIIIVSNTLNWRNKKDFTFGSLIKEINEKKPILRIDFPVSSVIGIKRILQQKQQRRKHLDFKSAEEYKVDYNHINKSLKRILNRYYNLRHSPVYYKSYDITDVFYEQMDFHICHYLLRNCIYYTETLSNIIKTENPDCLVVTDEYNPIGRATVTVGKIHCIKTIAIQHGVVSAERPGFYHYFDEISNKAEYKSPYYPLPDTTAVFGPYYKELLETVGNYPPASVEVTGSIRYDDIIKRRQSFDRDNTLVSLGIDPDQKVILYTSQPISKEENDKVLSALINAISGIPDLQLIIKLHYAEKGVNESIISEYDNEIIILQNYDIYELINACDVLITVFSTTALEAMILERPVITINLTGKRDMMPYAESGAALGVYSRNDLKNAILAVFEDENVISSLRTNSRKFVYQHAYEVDGNATKRLMDIVLLDNKLP